MMVTCMHKRVKIKHNPERQGGHLHAEEVEDQIPPERHGGHLQAEEGEYKVQLITEHIVITCMQKKVRIEFNSIQNDREITYMQERMNFKSNSMLEAMVVTCVQMEGQAEAPHSIKSLSSTDSLIGFNLFCKAYSCRQMYPQVPFSVWISELIFLRAKHTHLFTFTDSCKLRQISETLAGF